MMMMIIRDDDTKKEFKELYITNIMAVFKTNLKKKCSSHF